VSRANERVDAFRYLVVLSQHGKATWENRRWLGKLAADCVDGAAALDSCPELDVYLDARGQEGWELTSVSAHEQHERLFLKRRAAPG